MLEEAEVARLGLGVDGPDGDGFLRRMVRTLAGTLVECGVGLRDPDSLPALLASRDREQAGICAPGGGLCLEEVMTAAG